MIVPRWSSVRSWTQPASRSGGSCRAPYRIISFDFADIKHVCGGPELNLNDINQAAQIAYEWGGADVDLTFGASVDDDMAAVMQVTIIAAGIMSDR